MSTAEPTAPRADGVRGTLLAAVLLALAGAYFAWEGHGQSLRMYQFAAYGAGALLASPLLLALVFGARWLRLFRRLGLVALGLGLGVGLAELGVRLNGSSDFVEIQLEDDERLGYRVVAHTGGTDAWGFRNAERPERVDVFCMGDSQTWGTNITREQAWPAALARRTERSVYNTGTGGWGVLQYLQLLDEALELEARLLVVCLYFGNDLADAHRFASLEPFARFRDAELDYPDEVTGFLEPKRSPNQLVGLVDGLLANSRVLWKVTNTIKERLRTTPALADHYWRDPDSVEYTEGAIHTWFTPGKRRGVLELSIPGIADGLRISGEAYAELAQRCADAQLPLAVVLLPTKEYAYWRLLDERSHELAEALGGAGRAEQRAREAVRALLDPLELRVIDPLPEMLQALRDDRPLWPAYSDGHIDAAGSELVAAVVQRDLADWLSALGTD